ncbi:MAG: histidine phosphatase family protein [Chloroflexota bacterium]
MTIERILLIRHGQTDWNVEGRWQGYEPVPLNQEGWTQAKMVAQSMRGRLVGSIVSSDLPRAYETASAIGHVLGLEPRADERWREFNMGIFQGNTRDEIIRKFPDEWHGFQSDYWDFHIPSGESRRMLQNRIYGAWQALLESAVGPEVVVVSHGGSLKTLLLRLFPDFPGIDGVHLGNTSITTLERVPHGWHPAQVASVEHLAVASNDETGEAAL